MSKPAYWLYEAGICENRAALIEQGELAEAHVEREGGGPRAGAVIDARLIERWDAGRTGIMAFDGGEALLRPLPKGVSEGGAVRIKLVREALSESGGKAKRALASLVEPDTAISTGPTLLERIGRTGLPVEHCHAASADRLAGAGWHEAMEEALSGRVAFTGGELLIEPTAAMTVIDIDGTLPPRDLALAAAPVVAKAIRRLGLAGNIGVDFPTLEAKADRTAVADAFDATMRVDCERTSVNGFGFMQVVTKRERPSLPELVQADPTATETLALLRSAERDGGTGPLAIDAGKIVLQWLKKHRACVQMLEKRTGRPVILASDNETL